MNPETGKYIVYTGIAVILIGILIYFFHDKLGWFGRLPGDIRVERENMKFYFPITTMILISVLLSLGLWLFRKLF